MGRLEKAEIGSVWMAPNGEYYRVEGYCFSKSNEKRVIVYIVNTGYTVTWDLPNYEWFPHDIDISSSLMKELL